MVSSKCYGTSQGIGCNETKNKCDRMERSKARNNKGEQEERNLEVEKKMEDKRKRNRFINDMSLKVNRRIRNQQHENMLQAKIELLTKITKYNDDVRVTNFTDQVTETSRLS